MDNGSNISLKRAYDPPEKSDGPRFLVDHLWPRGLKKESLHLESWEKAVAPSTRLRQWFGHNPVRWPEFERRYFAELDEKPEAWQPLLDAAHDHKITLVFGAHDREHNNAVALKEYLEGKIAGKLNRHRGRLVTS